jgi:hypothetical protein
MAGGHRNDRPSILPPGFSGSVAPPPIFQCSGLVRVEVASPLKTATWLSPSGAWPSGIFAPTSSRNAASPSTADMNEVSSISPSVIFPGADPSPRQTRTSRGPGPSKWGPSGRRITLPPAVSSVPVRVPWSRFRILFRSDGLSPARSLSTGIPFHRETSGRCPVD